MAAQVAGLTLAGLLPPCGMAAKLRLKDVTVCAADCLHPQLAARALQICLDHCDFADAALYTDQPVDGRFRTEIIPPIRSLDDYSRFCLKDLAERTATPFVLVVQWDGYIVNPDAWSSSFLRYDYIGAPGYSNEAARFKPWVVGNGGFSLRSRRLLEASARLPSVKGMPEDNAICEAFRPGLERDGIKFAPERLADRFSFQQRRPTQRTFGFHGLFNLPRVEPDDVVVEIASALTQEELRQSHFFSLLHHCFLEKREALAGRLYGLVRRDEEAGVLRKLLERHSGNTAFAAREIATLEELYAAVTPS